MSRRPSVIIVGGGFGGLCAAQALKSAPVDVTLIDRNNYHLFQPLLYQVATGSLSAGEIAAPLRSVLSRQKNARVLLGAVVDIDPIRKHVLLADGADFEYDWLIVAAGSQSAYYGHEAWREWAPSLKSVEEAIDVRHKILYAFEVAERIGDPAQRRAWLTFVIVGAGPTGVELAGAIAEIARQTLKNDFRSIDPKEAQIILMDSAARVLPPFPEDLAEKAKRSLVKLGVEVRTGVMVKDIDKEGLTIETHAGTHRLEARTVIWAGGVTVPALGKTLASRTKAETDRSGRIKVGPQLTVANYPDLYVIGDLALALNPDGMPLPGVAQVAGNLAVIGRWSAVANAFGVHMSGLPAWLIWAFIHLMYIVQFQSRILVFLQWAIQDLTFSRGARLITGTAATDFNFNNELASIAKKPTDGDKVVVNF
ncbi:MAG: FAD-dependent oxidoreductase [Acidobacteria bacterium]|nr:MAG: FAD-dependent oxidoreductase [Acidobacteriota bacterium]